MTGKAFVGKNLSDELLSIVQSNFPLSPDPYSKLAGMLGVKRFEVIDAISALYDDGRVRRIGASFSSGKLGYVSTLCALSVPDERLSEVADIVNAFSGVTHNYRRVNHYNMWFTLITKSEEDRLDVLREIITRSGCSDILDMPAKRLFKIRVDFGKTHSAALDANAAAKQPNPFNADDPLDVEIVRWAQGDIARRGNVVIERPFHEGANAINVKIGSDAIDESSLLDRLNQLLANGTIRRFGAMVRHRMLGYTFNGMTVWDVTENDVAECGERFSALRFVSHCYERPRAKTWPYNLYAMVHASSQEELDILVEKMQESVPQAGDPLVLISTQEYKKTSMRFFEEGS